MLALRTFHGSLQRLDRGIKCPPGPVSQLCLGLSSSRDPWESTQWGDRSGISQAPSWQTPSLQAIAFVISLSSFPVYNQLISGKPLHWSFVKTWSLVLHAGTQRVGWLYVWFQLRRVADIRNVCRSLHPGPMGGPWRRCWKWDNVTASYPEMQQLEAPVPEARRTLLISLTLKDRFPFPPLYWLHRNLMLEKQKCVSNS